MNEGVEELNARAENLSAPERADLAYFLLSSPEPKEEGSEEAWRIESARQLAEIRGGTAVGRPAEEVLAELRERYP
jgi:Putative addiction module component